MLSCLALVIPHLDPNLTAKSPNPLTQMTLISLKFIMYLVNPFHRHEPTTLILIHVKNHLSLCWGPSLEILILIPTTVAKVAVPQITYLVALFKSYCLRKLLRITHLILWYILSHRIWTSNARRFQVLWNNNILLLKVPCLLKIPDTSDTKLNDIHYARPLSSIFGTNIKPNSTITSHTSTKSGLYWTQKSKLYLNFWPICSNAPPHPWEQHQNAPCHSKTTGVHHKAATSLY